MKVQIQNVTEKQVRLKLGRYLKRLQPGEIETLNLDLKQKKDLNLLRMLQRCPATLNEEIMLTEM